MSLSPGEDELKGSFRTQNTKGREKDPETSLHLDESTKKKSWFFSFLSYALSGRFSLKKEEEENLHQQRFQNLSSKMCFQINGLVVKSASERTVFSPLPSSLPPFPLLGLRRHGKKNRRWKERREENFSFCLSSSFSSKLIVVPRPSVRPTDRVVFRGKICSCNTSSGRVEKSRREKAEKLSVMKKTCECCIDGPHFASKQLG